MPGLSCNSALLARWDVVESMRLLADQGFQAIDVSLELEPPFLPVPKPHMYVNADAAERARVARGAQACGLAFGTLNAHTNLVDGDPEARARNRTFVAEAMQLASDLGCRYVIVGGGAAGDAAATAPYTGNEPSPAPYGKPGRRRRNKR